MEYITGLNMNSTHIAKILEKFSIYNGGKLKCRIPILMQNIPDSAPISTSTRISKTNMLNVNKANIKNSSTITNVNYIDIDVPIWIRKLFDADKYGNVTANKKIIITFIGGDINHIKVIGRYE